VDGDGVNELETAWDPVSSQPSAERPFGLANFNMAHALGRSGAWGRLYDATTGEALYLGWARILSNYHCKKKYNLASAGIGRDGNLETGEFDILQIPWNDCRMRFRVIKKGVTNGSKEYGFGIMVDGQQNPRQVYYQAEDLAVPPPNGMSYVVNWNDDTEQPIDFDVHLLLPSTQGEVCDVGPAPALALDPATFCGSGSLNSPPFAQFQVESHDTGVNFEAVRFPQLINTPPNLPYSFFVVNNEAELPARGYLAARLWSGGNIAWEVHAGDGTVVQSDPLCSIVGGEADCRVWLPFTMDVVPINGRQGRIFNILNEFGDGVNLAAIPF
jgi:hypothetical protein